MFKIGDRVMVGKCAPAWQGAVGSYAGTEKTIIGIRHRIDFDNGFSGLFAYKDIDYLKPQIRLED